MTRWLTIREAQEEFKIGREQVKVEARLAGALHYSGSGRKKYVIDAETYDYYRKTKMRA